jgi:preprotein translocase subunit SecA
VGDIGQVKGLVGELFAFLPDIEPRFIERLNEFGEEKWYEVMRRLMLQVSDILWVEHLEVMQHTRSSVSLRAYGQQDPLIEYRKEAIRLFKEMQDAFFYRVAELIPTVHIEAVEKEEAELKKAQEHISLQGGGETDESKPQTPLRKGGKIGRNELVTITDGTVTETMKFKKAESLLQSGVWRIVGNKG